MKISTCSKDQIVQALREIKAGEQTIAASAAGYKQTRVSDAVGGA